MMPPAVRLGGIMLSERDDGGQIDEGLTDGSWRDGEMAGADGDTRW